MFIRKLRLLTNIIFISFLFIPTIAIVLSPRFFTFLHNINQNPSTFQTEQEALRRSTPLWKKAVSIYSTTLYRLGSSSNKSVMMLGSDQWTFLGDLGIHNFTQGLHRILMPDDDAKQWIEILKLETAYAHKLGIPFIFIIVPAKWDIYPDKLPKWAAQYQKRPTSLDIIFKLAKDNHINMLDLRKTLKQGRKVDDTFSRYNAHWTEYAAWLAWQQIGPELKKELPTIKLFGIGGLKSTSAFFQKNEFEDVVGLNIPDRRTTPVLSMKFPPYMVMDPDGNDTEIEGIQQTNNSQLPRNTENNHSTSPLRALLLRDSMGDVLSPYMQATFKNTYQLHFGIGLSPVNIPGLIEQYKPDVIIYIMAERHLFFPLGDLNYWRSLTLFENTPSLEKYLWTPNKPSNFMKITGDKTLTSPLKIEIPDLKQHSTVVKINLKGHAEGLIQLTYTKNKTEVTEQQFFGHSMNELYFTLPKGISDNNFQIRRNIDQGRITLVSIKARNI